MRSWLYQMSREHWPEENYRVDVWEGDSVSFTIGTVRGVKGDEFPAPGDLMICWYAKTVSRNPGVCGWGIVMSLKKRREMLLVWRPVFPSDVLKLNPLMDDSLASMVDSVRQGMPRATLWLIPPALAAGLIGRILATGSR